jgi:hypothetical protein
MGYQPHFNACPSIVYIQLRWDILYRMSKFVIAGLYTLLLASSGEVFNKRTAVPIWTINNIHDTLTYVTKDSHILTVIASIVRLRATNKCLRLPCASNVAGLGLGYITASLSSILNLERRLQSWKTSTRHRHHCL